MEDTGKKLIYVGIYYKCPYCHAEIKDDIDWILDKPFKYCPCCGGRINHEDSTEDS